MKSFLLLIAGLAVLFAPIPLITWAVTGRWQDAWEAVKGYWRVMGLMLAAAGVLLLVIFLASATA